MSKSSLARRTVIEIAFDGVDITESIRPYLLSVTYTDNEEDEDGVDAELPGSPGSLRTLQAARRGSGARP